eukprot:NODE_2787_length_1120_cov_33.407096_g2558_i0.p1 GENE.NODE_2787_length_1120_cov_33.407096_g2558_i0~~NODE_2787_length_1120_cov_33.407096_g2558_i0.p1  ORF type:complete len:262 (+),score=41.50 NODE_2787_length_1120_cov_33.407096_g2558_i0:53-787(+)
MDPASLQSFWKPVLSARIPCAVLGPQPWLEPHPVTLLCRCTCDACRKLTGSSDCAPWNGYIVALSASNAWLVRSFAVAGSCPNSNTPIRWRDVCMLGLMECFAVLAYVDSDEEDWRTVALDLSQESEPLVLEVLDVLPYVEVVLVVGQTQKECLARTRKVVGYLKEMGQAGFPLNELRFESFAGSENTRDIEPKEIQQARSIASWDEEWSKIPPGSQISWKDRKPSVIRNGEVLSSLAKRRRSK